MAKRVAISTLNATTIDILNTIRQNASAAYQNQVPVVAKATDIPKVGEVLYGYPALANQFLTELINRIASVRINSAVFNNAYAELKKGYLEFGETVEEVFVNITKARVFSAEKAEARELKRSLPDVRTALHTMNYRVQYPITIQDEDLKQAFLTINGVQDLIARIVDSVYTSAEYDEFLLFKYLMIKAITAGKMYPVTFDQTNMNASAESFRGISNLLTFMKNTYNAEGVETTTPKNDQYIFMDAMFNAKYDVEVLAAAFNMDKATFAGHLKLIDDWTTFDNERFSDIMSESDGFEPVSDAELALMKNVKAVLVDKEFFQIYDNNNKFTEKYVASGMYWNYFYNVWKTVSYSPFSNAVVFLDDNASTALPNTLTAHISSKSESAEATVFTIDVDTADEAPQIANGNYEFVQTEALTKAGIAVHKYGAVVIPASQATTQITLVVKVSGEDYTGATAITAASDVDATVTLNGPGADTRDS